MEYRQLSNTPLRISRIGFGGMSLGTEEAPAAQLIGDAMAAGINYFDTADLYDHGQNETIVGKALRAHRKEVIIATKVGNQWRPDGSGWDWNPRKDYILTAVEESLRRLQTDYIDLYQLHGGTIEDNIAETIEAFEILIQQGKIRSYGISSIRPEVIREYVQRGHPASVMMQYSLLDRRPEESAMPLLQQHGIGILARGAVAKGLLVDKPAAPFLEYDADTVARAAAAIRQCSGNNRSPAQTALKFVLQQPAVTAAVVGIRTPHQLQDAIAAIDAPALDETALKILTAAIPVNYYTQYR